MVQRATEVLINDGLPQKSLLGGHLKQILPIWLGLMFDPVKDVHQAARSAFQSALAQNKQATALIFCKKEILDHISEQLLYRNCTFPNPPLIF